MPKMTVGRWGRILYGVVFVVFGVLHLMNSAVVANFVPEYIPFPGVFWVVISGIIMLAAGVAILTKRYVRYATMTLAILLAVFIVLVHLPNLPDTMQFFLKDIGLVAGALLILSRYPKHE